ncbi:helix-turn-helix domain-containing protein [Candidatus Micrarchaeota archaeon]|nr:helix-turn-helix domain-containing protein [Candidatus Micrarchaeota archaeon]
MVFEEPAGPEFPGDRSGPRDRFAEGVADGDSGVRRGRPRKACSEERLAQVVRLYFLEKLSMRQVAEVIGVSHMSVYRMLSDPAVELLI